MLQRQQSSLWPACPAAAGERSRFAHARIQGRPLTSRHLPRFGRSRNAGTASTRPIEIASTDCHVEWQRLSRSKTPSIDKEPGRLFTLVPSVFQDGTTDHDALSPIADSPRRARPCPPLSAATENGFLGPTPLADFCNHFSQNTGTPSDRPFLARSSPFRRSSLPRRGTETASGTAPRSSFGATRLASEDAGRTGRKAPSQLARGGARGRLEYLPSTSCHRPALRGT